MPPFSAASAAMRFDICETLNNGGSTHFGLGAAVEETRRWGVLILPPCVNRSTDRYAGETNPLELRGADSQQNRQAVIGTIRVPLRAIRGFSPEAVQHTVAIREAFGPFTSLLDFCRRVDCDMVSRRNLQALIKVGAFAFTELPTPERGGVAAGDIRAQPAASRHQ